jgi:MFS family permease
MSSVEPPDLAEPPDADAVSTDPTRWVTLAITIVSAFIVVLDNTVLNVAIPTILREFDTSLSSLEWVITGYALTFATLLIIGGRLGDVYGHRRVFIIGAALFGVGSLIAALSQGVPQLILGEAIIEGIGASLMLPATLAILSGTFRGRERATAFAAWGATAASPWPSARWSAVPHHQLLVAVGVRDQRDHCATAIVGGSVHGGPRRRSQIVLDVPARLIAAGMFLLVFALSEGAIYGWWNRSGLLDRRPRHMARDEAHLDHPDHLRHVGRHPHRFYFLERWKERNDRDPLFEFKHLRLRTYRYGLLTGLIVAMGQLGITFVLPVFLQDGRHLSAVQNGWWQLPTGIFVIIGAQLGGRLIRYLGTTVVVRIGFLAYAIGVVLIFRAVSVDITALELFPGLAFYGIGIGFALAQLTNVVLSEIPKESSGVASGANTTVRQVGAALGVAVIGAILTTQTISHSTTQLNRSQLPAGTKSEAIAGIHALGANYSPPAGTSHAVVNVIQSAVEHGVVSGTRMALVFAFVMITIGGFISLLIPNIKVAPEVERARRAVEGFEPVEPLDVDPALIEGATERAGTNGAATQRARG